MRWLLIIAVLMVSAPTVAEVAQHEHEYTRVWCTQHNGEQEYILPDGTRVDCLTDEYAVEVDRPHRWAEAIGQALYYSAATQRKPGIVLIAGPDDGRYIRRIRLAERAHELDIQLWLIPRVE